MIDLNRPTWDAYFLTLANVIAQKSMDTSTKCGCVVVNDEHTILSTGYNSPPRGSRDIDIPIDVRPDKYWYMEHAERNAIYNASRLGVSLVNSTFYITGSPCIDCFRGILSVGAKAIVHGENRAKMLMIDEREELDLTLFPDIEIRKLDNAMMHKVLLPVVDKI